MKKKQPKSLMEKIIDNNKTRHPTIKVHLNVIEQYKGDSKITKALKEFAPSAFVDTTHYCNIGDILTPVKSFPEHQPRRKPLLVCYDKYNQVLFLVNAFTGYVFKNRVKYNYKAFTDINNNQADELFKGAGIGQKERWEPLKELSIPKDKKNWKPTHQIEKSKDNLKRIHRRSGGGTFSTTLHVDNPLMVKR